MIGLMLLVALFSGGQPPASAKKSSPAGNSSLTPSEEMKLRTAMTTLTKGFKNVDVRLILACFSKKRTFTLRTVPRGDDTYPVAVQSYNRLESNLKHRGDYYQMFFGNEDPIRSFFETTNWEPWSLEGRTFYPPGNASERLLYFRWRKEAGKYVIDQIGIPES